MKSLKFMYWFLMGLMALQITIAMMGAKLTLFNYCGGWFLAGYYLYNGQKWFDLYMKELERR